jgi:regulator of RNase E activity RraA
MTQKSITPETLNALRRFDSATTSNAVEHFKVRDQVTGYASMELRSQFPDYETMVGYAVTCTGDTTANNDDRPRRLGDLLDHLRAAPKPAVLVIQYQGSDRLRSCFIGDMMAKAMHKLGVVGIVTDGGFRDKKGIKRHAPNLQVFSPGTVVSRGHGAFLDFGIPVSVCGLEIEAGDLLHGDANGLLTIPRAIAADVVDRANDVVEQERKYFELLDRDDFQIDNLKQAFGI